MSPKKYEAVGLPLMVLMINYDWQINAASFLQHDCEQHAKCQRQKNSASDVSDRARACEPAGLILHTTIAEKLATPHPPAIFPLSPPLASPPEA